MNTTRDPELGDALTRLPTPPPRMGFWADVRAELTEAALTPDSSPNTTTLRACPADTTNSGDPITNVTLTPGTDRHGDARPRPQILIAAAAIVAIAAVGAVAWFRSSPHQVVADQTRSTDTGHREPAESKTAPALDAADPATPSTDPESTLSTVLDEQSLGNLSYVSPWSDTSDPVQLTDGTWQSEPVAGGTTVTTIAVFDFVSGDLTGDGIDDAAVILVADPGGSGTFYDLYAVDGESFDVIGPAQLGDRISDTTLAITPNAIEVNYIDIDGGAHQQVYAIDNGSLNQLAPRSVPFPLGEPYLDTGCLVAGESDLTIEFLDDTTTLLACDPDQAATVAASLGGTIVATADGLVLVAVPA